MRNLTSQVTGSSNAWESESRTERPVWTSVIMGTWVTHGEAKEENTSWMDPKGVSVGTTTDWPWQWPHMNVLLEACDTTAEMWQ